MSELKPCPFCGCVDIFRGYDDNGETCVLYIYCGRCNCQTNVFDNEESCAQAWNTRIPQCEKDCEGYWAGRAQAIDECVNVCNKLVYDYASIDQFSSGKYACIDAIKELKEQP